MKTLSNTQIVLILLVISALFIQPAREVILEFISFILFFGSALFIGGICLYFYETTQTKS